MAKKSKNLKKGKKLGGVKTLSASSGGDRPSES